MKWFLVPLTASIHLAVDFIAAPPTSAAKERCNPIFQIAKQTLNDGPNHTVPEPLFGVYAIRALPEGPADRLSPCGTVHPVFLRTGHKEVLAAQRL